MTNYKIDSSARVIGETYLGNKAYIAQGTVLRGQDAPIKVGSSTMVLEKSVLISTKNNPLTVGRKTVFGHKCIGIGTNIGDLCEIGNGVIMLPGSKIGNMCIFGEGSLIPENTLIPDESVVVGRPARVIRKLTDQDKNMIKRMRSGDISIKPGQLNLYDKHDNDNLSYRKKGDNMGKIYPYKDIYPQIADTAILYDSAEVTGDVIIGENTIIGAGVKIIGNSHGPVKIGNNVQILENSVLHLLPDNQLIIHDNVTIGPGCIIHGTNIGQGSVIESGAIVCDNSVLGENTLVKSGTLVKQNSSFSNNVILEGYMAKEVDKVSGNLERPSWAITNL